MARNQTARRREVRRTLTVRHPSRLKQLRESRLLFPVLFALALALFSSAMAWSAGRHLLAWEKGQQIEQPILARVEFEAIDEAKTRRQRDDAYEREPAVYAPNSTYLNRVREDLLGLAELVSDETLSSIDSIPVETRRNLDLDPATLEALHRILEGEQETSWRRLVDRFVMDGLAALAILSPAWASEERNARQRAPAITLIHPSGSRLRRYDNAILNVEQDPEPIRSALASFLENKVPRPLARTIVAAAMNKLQPTYLLAPEATAEAKEAQAQSQPPETMTYAPGDVLAGLGQQLTELDLEVIRHERQAYWAALSPTDRWVKRLAHFGVFAGIAVVLWCYIAAYKPRLMSNPVRGLALTSLMLLGQALSILGTMLVSVDFDLAALATPTLLAVMVVTIAYDQRFALAFGLLQSLLVAGSLDAEFHQALVVLTGVAATIAQLPEVRTRSKLLIAGFHTGLVMALAAAAIGAIERPLLELHEYLLIGKHALGLAGAGTAAGLLAQGMLPFLEQAFGVSTAMTLKELNDANHPLLRRLAERAPGTYQHSLRIADMAEGAAEAIGANGLLCRVGAMYHDIGKMNKPQYFIENQQSGPNKHDKLTPAMSHLIIIGHVKDGVEMAREYSLPADIRQFIETHHGTTLVEFFYHAARKKNQEKTHPEPSEFEFRYPGPKPRTREAAILMLSDSVEGAVRSLPDPTPVRIEQMVHQIANKRLLDGQFNESSLTLQELHHIETSLTKTLCAIYHGRVRYPDQEKKKTAPSPEPQAPASA